MSESLTQFDRFQPVAASAGGRPVYDVVIVGAGIAGAVFADRLAGRGLRILLLEKGRHFTRHATQFVENELALWERAWPNSQYEVTGNAFGGAPNFGQGVGGGSLVWTSVCLRFMRHDFRMRSTFGAVPGASLADWPIGYDDLAPYYDRAEEQIGVAGAPLPWAEQRRRAYPNPAFDFYRSSRLLRLGLRRQSLRSGAGPVAVASRAGGGRAACVHCGYCRSSCRIDAKFQADRALLAPLLARGRIELVAQAEVLRLTQGRDGASVTGVDYLDLASGNRRSVQGRLFLVCNNPLETPRLFLNSANAFHPRGLGNDRDQVGRNLFSHVGLVGMGVTADCVNAGVGYNMGNVVSLDRAYPAPGAGYVGGYAIESLNGSGAGVMAVDPLRGLWGQALKDAMRDYDRSLFAVVFGEGLPVRDNRVALSATRRDANGQAQARIHYEWHANDLRIFDAARTTLTGVFRAAGAGTVRLNPTPFEAHLAGSMRMGDDPRSSVVDRWGKVHGLNNVYVGGASQFVTGSSVNPTLTLYALALRTADHLVERFGLAS
ncbi:GMC family oxidoreductase [Derxia lacustris]|uniref:GMC family oxidoreductase n=1 Tax=Derxia lacustris TaxID=764842 RepID=UPI000A1772CB|nr:GMC family oxidoreductase [Derxia lacustris]